MSTPTEFFSVSKINSSLFILILFVALFVVWDLFKKRDLFRFSRKLKGYNFLPILGNAHHLLEGNVFANVQKVVKKHGLPCNIWISHIYNYVTADASEAQVILNNPNAFNKSIMYDNFKLLFDHTLLVAHFETWKRNRKIFTKSFNMQILNSYVEMLNEKACVLVNVLKENQNRDMNDIFGRYALDSFCATNLQLELNAEMDIAHEIPEVLNRLQDTCGKRMFSSCYYPEFLWLQSTEAKNFYKDLNHVKKIIYEIIQNKKKDFKQNIEYRENVEKLPLMEMMLEAEGTKFTDENIFREVILFIGAGSDTTAATLAFLFTLLGMHPEIQESLYQEIKLHVGLEDPISHSDLIKLKSIERAIYEAMRLFPVIPFLGRRATADIDLGSRILPSGANIVVSVFDLHRSEIYWKNPLEYNPDRFLPDEVAKRHPYCYIPFSCGPRDCIGKKFGMMLMKIAVAHVLRSYTITSNYKSVEDMKLESCLTMKTVHELDCKFKARTH